MRLFHSIIKLISIVFFKDYLSSQIIIEFRNVHNNYNNIISINYSVEKRMFNILTTIFNTGVSKTFLPRKKISY